LAVEEDETLAAEMAEWEAASIADGLSDSEAIGRAEFRRGMRSIADRG